LTSIERLFIANELGLGHHLFQTKGYQNVYRLKTTTTTKKTPPNGKKNILEFVFIAKPL